MGTLLAFIAGPYGALIQKGLLILIVVGGIWFGYHSIVSSAKQTQLLVDQNAQLIQVEKDNKVMAGKIDTIQKVNGDILIRLNGQNQKVIEKHDEVTNYITSPGAQKDNRESSPVLKNTIGMLRGK